MEKMLNEIKVAKSVRMIYNVDGGWDLSEEIKPSDVPTDIQTMWTMHAGNVVLAVACSLMWNSTGGMIYPSDILDMFKRDVSVKNAEVYGYLDCGHHDEYNGVMFKIVIGNRHHDYEVEVLVVYNSTDGLQMKSVLVRENTSKAE